MKRIGGQKDLVEDAIPVLEDPDTARNLDTIDKLHDKAKQHRTLLKEVKEVVKGHVLSLSDSDQAIGRLRCGEFIIPFKVENQEEKEVVFTRPEGKKISLKIAPEVEKKDA